MEKETHTELSTRSLILLGLAVCIILLPFVNKPYHLDDPFYIWTGQHILEHPIDFYGFDINWSGKETPAAEENKNPPLVSYYMAVVGLIFGWKEWVMHVAFLIPAVAFVIGTAKLAARFCSRPLLAAAFLIATPAFLVSSTNVMAEIVMMAFYVWAIIAWMHAMDTDDNFYYMIGMLLLVCSALAKYFGVSLIPLFIVYTVIVKRKPGPWMFFLFLAFVVLMSYEGWTQYKYGVGLLGEAGDFVSRYRGFMEITRESKIVVGLSFVGGCLAPILFFSPFLWKKWAWLAWLGVATALFLLAYLKPGLFPEIRSQSIPEKDYSFLTHFTVFALTASMGVWLTISDFLKHRNRSSIFLACWIAGTFIFATEFNWAINARSIVPMAAPMAILVVRRMECQHSEQVRSRLWWIPVFPALALSLTLAYADYTLAASAKKAAIHLDKDLVNIPDTKHFAGHWGFQYYFQQLGGVPIDYSKRMVKRGEMMIIPTNNTWLWLEDDYYEPGKGVAIEFDVFPWASVWQRDLRAGFYADNWGSLPFAFGNVPKERYNVAQINRTGKLNFRFKDMEKIFDIMK
jgi:4-amino-4-deoxy-L-arabinose transferase-like glycosyltransferase